MTGQGKREEDRYHTLNESKKDKHGFPRLYATDGSIES